jgi:iron complex outermembrane receptor protein
LTDASDAVRPAQLRGRSPDQTLVLIDGRRRHSGSVVNIHGTAGRGSAQVDLNAIPIAAIERIEVLRDGPAAHYGSDAIAGVVNIALKQGATGGSLAGEWGQVDAGDGGSPWDNSSTLAAPRHCRATPRMPACSLPGSSLRVWHGSCPSRS